MGVCATGRLRSATQQGGGLVEVLVSLALLAVGLLGMMASHSAALRYTAMSQQRSTAQWLLQDMAERVLANLGRQPADEVFMLAYTAQAASWAAQAAVPQAVELACDTPTSVCDVAGMAQADVAQWRVAVRARLPQGSVHLAREGNSTLRLAVAWRESANAAATRASDACPSGLEVSLPEVRCLVWQVQL
jgi:type IV pilus assembly protein PilV